MPVPLPSHIDTVYCQRAPTVMLRRSSSAAESYCGAQFHDSALEVAWSSPRSGHID